MDNSHKEILKNLKKIIIEDFGKKCSTYSDACMVCRIHFAYQIIHQTYGLYSHLTPDFPALKKAMKKKSNQRK